MKKNWQKRRRAAGLPSDKPNLVMSYSVQVGKLLLLGLCKVAECKSVLLCRVGYHLYMCWYSFGTPLHFAGHVVAHVTCINTLWICCVFAVCASCRSAGRSFAGELLGWWMESMGIKDVQIPKHVLVVHASHPYPAVCKTSACNYPNITLVLLACVSAGTLMWRRR
jgi:hypothetical protein